jgi:hypothetical protein
MIDEVGKIAQEFEQLPQVKAHGVTGTEKVRAPEIRYSQGRAYPHNYVKRVKGG